MAVELPVERNGEIAYLLSIAISVDRFLEILRSHLENSGWLMGVTGTDDRIIARSWDHERFVGQSASQAFMDNTKDRAGVFTSTSLDGVPVFNVYLRSPLTGWRIAAGIPTSMLEAPLYRSLTVLALMAGIGLATSVLLALLYARFLAEPVSALRRVAVSFARREPVRAIRTGIQELDGVAKGLAEASDILKQRDQVQESLINELNHRVKNTLATIQSIARQTRRRASSLDEFGQAFEGRLMALAKSHDTLTRSGWAGGDLQNIVPESCRPFSDLSRLVLNGPPVEIPNRVVVGIGMVLHELATNAAQVRRVCREQRNGPHRMAARPGEPHGNLHLRWKEHDGPPSGAGQHKRLRLDLDRIDRRIRSQRQGRDGVRARRPALRSRDPPTVRDGAADRLTGNGAARVVEGGRRITRPRATARSAPLLTPHCRARPAPHSLPRPLIVWLIQEPS